MINIKAERKGGEGDELGLALALGMEGRGGLEVGDPSFPRSLAPCETYFSQHQNPPSPVAQFKSISSSYARIKHIRSNQHHGAKPKIESFSAIAKKTQHSRPNAFIQILHARQSNQRRLFSLAQAHCQAAARLINAQPIPPVPCIPCTKGGFGTAITICDQRCDWTPADSQTSNGTRHLAPGMKVNSIKLVSAARTATMGRPNDGFCQFFHWKKGACATYQSADGGMKIEKVGVPGRLQEKRL